MTRLVHSSVAASPGGDRVLLPRGLDLVGWREWLALPELGLERVKAKVDTGARTSSLHAYGVSIVQGRGRSEVCFKVHPNQRDSATTVSCRAVLKEERWVKSSNGKRELRPVIVTLLRLTDELWPIELTLTSRDMMGFRMLLGREAIRGRCVVNPGRSYLTGRPLRKKRKKKRTRKAEHRK